MLRCQFVDAIGGAVLVAWEVGVDQAKVIGKVVGVGGKQSFGKKKRKTLIWVRFFDDWITICQFMIRLLDVETRKSGCYSVRESQRSAGRVAGGAR